MKKKRQKKKGGTVDTGLFKFKEEDKKTNTVAQKEKKGVRGDEGGCGDKGCNRQAVCNTF